MHQVLSGYVERKEMPGLVALVNHHDDVHVETLGAMSFGHPAPMQRDAIFRIASLAKPMLPSQAPGTDEWQQKLGSLPWMRSPRLLHRDLARLDGFCFWQRNGQDASVDLRAEFRRIDRWIKLVDAAEIVRLDLPIDQFSSKFGLLPMT
jgi:Beta-lactamase